MGKERQGTLFAFFRLILVLYDICRSYVPTEQAAIPHISDYKHTQYSFARSLRSWIFRATFFSATIPPSIRSDMGRKAVTLS